MEEHPDELFFILDWDEAKTIVSSDGEWTRTLRYHIRRQLITAEWGKISSFCRTIKARSVRKRDFSIATLSVRSSCFAIVCTRRSS